jgi:hypothetical protein
MNLSRSETTRTGIRGLGWQRMKGWEFAGAPEVRPINVSRTLIRHQETPKQTA